MSTRTFIASRVAGAAAMLALGVAVLALFAATGSGSTREYIGDSSYRASIVLDKAQGPWHQHPLSVMNDSPCDPPTTTTWPTTSTTIQWPPVVCAKPDPVGEYKRVDGVGFSARNDNWRSVLSQANAPTGMLLNFTYQSWHDITKESSAPIGPQDPTSAAGAVIDSGPQTLTLTPATLLRLSDGGRRKVEANRWKLTVNNTQIDQIVVTVVDTGTREAWQLALSCNAACLDATDPDAIIDSWQITA